MSTCYADPNPRFKPAMRLILSITRSNPATVTTTFDHGYEDGIIVRFNIPDATGMMQLDKRKGTITVTGSDTFTVDINTTNFDEFAIPASPSWHENTCAMVVPIGQSSNMLSSAVQDVT